METHFIVVTTGSAGDLFPFLKLAVGLRQRGHRVTLVAPALHEAPVRQAGLEWHGTYADPAVLSHPDLWHPQRGFAIVWEAVRPGLRELRPLVQALPPGPCVILAHPLAVPEAAVCRALRPHTALVAAYLAPSNIPTVHDPLLLGPWQVPRWAPHGLRRWLWRQIGARLIDPVALPGINAERSSHGLAPAASLFALLAEAPDLSVTLFPSWFGAPQPDWPAPLVCGQFALYDPHPDAALSAELAAFLAGGSAPLVFTHGTGNLQAAGYFAAALTAVQRLGRRAVFLTGHREQVPASLPDAVLWQAYLPLKTLLPHCAALVHHGGIGTTAEALRAGIPQLIVPLAFDQFDNAARVMALGAGLSLPSRRLTPARLQRRLAQLLSTAELASGARRLAQRLAPVPSLDPLLDALEGTLGKSAPLPTE